MPSKRPGPSDYEAATETLGLLQQFALEHNMTVLLVHHAKKSRAEGNDIFDLSLGSIGINGVMDTLLMLERARKENIATLDITGRDIEERKLTLEFNRETGIWTLGENDALANIPSEQLAVLQALAAGHTTPKDIAAVTDKSSKNVNNMLKKLCAKGFAGKVRIGEYALTPVTQEAFAKRNLSGSSIPAAVTATSEEFTLNPEDDPEEPLGNFEVTDEDDQDPLQPVPF